MFHLLQNPQRPLISPHRHRTRRRRLHQTDRQPPIQAPNPLPPHHRPHRARHALRNRNIPPTIPAPRRPLNLQPLPDQIERKHARLGRHGRQHARRRVARPERQLQPRQRRPQRFVRREEEPHVRHHLADAGAEALEEPTRAFRPRNVPDAVQERGVDSVGALRGEARAEEVEWVSGRRRDGAGDGAGDEGFEGGGEGLVVGGREGVEEGGGLSVRRELDAAVEDVEGFGGDVAFPEALLRYMVSVRDCARTGCGAVVGRRTVMPSSRRIVLKVDRAPGYFGRVVVVDNGSVMELTWSWSRILMTSRGAMQNLDFHSLRSGLW